ncbi:hypothetical protein QR680_000231 [Steinernema hermaphroditum]|uniref:Uncharacterized protein n=1 Tax=Steinernema hermaphroditum TaxID=289476 RepID=A0AA39GTW7_9BILA|nr:hypothetical protein QR680_000231 [Steinernema hermaphroditum]
MAAVDEVIPVMRDAWTSTHSNITQQLVVRHYTKPCCSKFITSDTTKRPKDHEGDTSSRRKKKKEKSKSARTAGKESVIHQVRTQPNFGASIFVAFKSAKSSEFRTMIEECMEKWNMTEEVTADSLLPRATDGPSTSGVDFEPII